MLEYADDDQPVFFMAKILVFQHSPFEPLGLLVPLIKARKIRIRFLNFYRQSNFDIDLESYQGIIVLGGPQHPRDFDKHPHLLNELELIKKALGADIPILGICLGAQLLTQALDAKVFCLDTPEFGWHKIHINEENNFMTQPNASLQVFQWHQYGFECPKQAKLLAWNSDNLAQAFSYKNSLALQFHLEVDKALTERWLGHIKYLESLSQHLSVEEVEFIKMQTIVLLQKSKQFAVKTFNHFLDLITPPRIVMHSRHAGK